MKPILEIQNISKKFRIHHERQSYLSLRDSLATIFKADNSSDEDFYALKDINFNVSAGESIGIIGKNGAGKSTLLKILSRITPPTSGKIISRGKIASLLEVGTGFHTELTGRENIFLNGSILGMKQKEIQSKFDEIVDFSGTERFLDTPLKHYSSGMKLRLAFSVAAFLDPEILIIDEVLAVGDAEFQKKCMGKMEDVSKSGRTILFVSHNLSAVQALCKNSIYLKNGELFLSGKSNDLIREYLQINLSNKIYEKGINSSKETFIEKVSLIKENKKQDHAIEIEINIQSKIEKKVAIDFRLYTINGTPACFGSLGTFDESQMHLLKRGLTSLNVSLSTKEIANGLYYLSIDLTQPSKEYHDRAEQVLFFEVLNSPAVENGRVLLQEWSYGNYRIPVQII